MTISEVSAKFDLPQDTLRYYERVGLLPNVNRKTSGVRDYTVEDCRWVQFLKCMRSAGLSIEVLTEYVRLYLMGDDTLAARKQLLIDQRKQLVKRIDEMTSTLGRLDNKINNYEKAVAIQRTTNNE